MAVPARPIEGAPVDVAWGGVAHDAIVANDLLSGQVLVTIAAGAFQGSATVTFPRAFGAQPQVVATFDGGSGAFITVTTTPRSASQVGIYIRHRSDAISPGSYWVHWMAYGPRA
jgi:hypothetical protein